MQIADAILDHILAQRWQQGERIPSVRELASDIQVNPNTVMRTFNYLQDKGIIFNKRGIGYFVSEKAYEKTRNIRKDDFVHHFLPQVFKTMELLEMNFEDLKSIYETNGFNHNDTHHENQ